MTATTRAVAAPLAAAHRRRRCGVPAASGWGAGGLCAAPVRWRPVRRARRWLATRGPWWQSATPWALTRPSRCAGTRAEGTA
jgi:hypothetical protein